MLNTVFSRYLVGGREGGREGGSKNAKLSASLTFYNIQRGQPHEAAGPNVSFIRRFHCMQCKLLFRTVYVAT